MEVLAPEAREAEAVFEDALLDVRAWDALPDTKPRYELVEGRLVQKMTTTNAHAWAAGRLLIHLSNWGDGLGWRFLPEGTGVWLDERNGAVPDVIGFSQHQVLRPEATHNEPPFLVAEVLSPSTARRDRTRKKTRYAAIGIAMYLIIDTGNRTVEVFRRDAASEAARYGEPEVLGESDIWAPAELPGLSLEIDRLWL